MSGPEDRTFDPRNLIIDIENLIFNISDLNFFRKNPLVGPLTPET